MPQDTNTPAIASKFDAALERLKSALRSTTQSSLHDVASHYAAHQVISSQVNKIGIDINKEKARLAAKDTNAHPDNSILNELLEEQTAYKKAADNAQAGYQAVKQKISTAEAFLNNPETTQAVKDAYAHVAKEHNPAVAEGLFERAMKEIAKEQHQLYSPEHGKQIEQIIKQHGKISEDETVSITIENALAEKSYNEGILAHRDALTQLTGKLKEIIPQDNERSFTARLKREKNLISNAWEGLDSRTGEAMQFGKARVAAGGAFMLGSAALGLHDIYVGVVGGTDEATHQKKDANFSKVAIGVGELALGALLARKMATGAFITR